MSYLAFTSREREVHVRGWERHRLPGICQDFGLAGLGLHPGSSMMGRLTELMSPKYREMDCFKSRQPGWAAPWCESYRLFLTQGDDDTLSTGPLIQYKGHQIFKYPLLLNTVLALGSDSMKLAARLAGQSYSHIWVDGPDRNWMADLITDGLLTDVFRLKIKTVNPSLVLPGKTVTEYHKTGWPDVIELLRESETGPVVMSVSTGDDFPDASTLGIPDQDFWEIQEQTNGNDQIWDLAGIWLRNRHGGHRIEERTHQDYRFDHRLSTLDLAASDWDDRLDRALEEKRI